MIYIYTLSDPTTNEVRYVGKTINIKRRYKQHLYDKRTTHKCNWVQSLRKEGLKPILTIIETCNDNWQEREIYWISQYDNLTNFSDGGGVDYVRVTTEETKEKIRQANLGKPKTSEQKEKIKQGQSKTKISVDGVIYESLMEASRKLNIHPYLISKRCKSNSNLHSNYFHI